MHSSQENAPTLGNLPPHVAPHLIFDFDIHRDPRIDQDVQGSYARTLAAAPDIFWTRCNGGHWIVKSFEAISRIVSDPEHFSAREMQIPRVENPPLMIPLNLDPPDNLPYRRALAPMFGPVAIKELEPRIREWASRLVEAVVEQGACDFQAEVSKIYPVSVFMELMGMDLARLREFRGLAEAFFDYHGDEAEFGRLAGAIQALLAELLAEKRQNPDNKLMSHLLTVDIGGRVMRDDEVLAMAFVLFLGGMDTVTNVTGFAYQQLAQMPEVQARLAEDPSLCAAFADEAIRLYGVVNTPRLVSKAKDIGDAAFRPGEMVVSILCLGSRDPRRFEHPEVFDLDRKRTAHLTFSTGPHLCVGHILGRTELRILTEEWIRRIPVFRAVPGERHAFRLGTVMALESLPIQWPSA